MSATLAYDARDVERLCDFITVDAWLERTANDPDDEARRNLDDASAVVREISKHTAKLVASGQLIIRRMPIGYLLGPKFGATLAAIWIEYAKERKSDPLGAFLPMADWMDTQDGKSHFRTISALRWEIGKHRPKLIASGQLVFENNIPMLGPEFGRVLLNIWREQSRKRFEAA